MQWSAVGPVGFARLWGSARWRYRCCCSSARAYSSRVCRNLRDLDPGFRVQNLLTFSVDPHMNGYPDTRTMHFYRQLREGMDSLPGVHSGSLAVVPILSGDEWDSSITIEGYPRKQGEQLDPHMNYIAPDFFKTLGIPVQLGRDFNERDEQNAPKVAVVNQKFVKRFFGDRNPLGHHIGMGSDPGTKTEITIVGVVGDTKYEDLRQDIPIELYLPYTQIDFATQMTAYVRTSQPSTAAFPALRGLVQNLDSNLPMRLRRETMVDRADKSLVTRAYDWSRAWPRVSASWRRCSPPSDSTA